MTGLRLHAAGSLTVAAAVVLVSRAAGAPYGWAELVFLTMLAFAASVALRLAVTEVRAASRARSRAAALEGIPPEAAARAAMTEERRRLTADIVRHLRLTLGLVADDATAALAAADAGSPVDLAGVVRRIQGRARDAASELRRQVGLLRDAEADTTVVGGHVDTGRPPLDGLDVTVAGVTVLLAVVDLVVLAPYAQYTPTPGTAAGTVAAASLIAWRRRAPHLAVGALGAVHLVGVLAGAAPVGGLWAVVALPVLFWAAGAATFADRPAGSGTAGVPAGVPLVAAASAVVVIGGATWTDEPDNVAVAVTVCVAGWGGGLLAGRSRRAAGRAAAQASAHQARLDGARQAAVAAERHAVAREMHDVVSHAVGVVAVHASAAEVLLPVRRDQAVESLRLVAAAARDAVGELDRLGPGATRAGRRTAADVAALAGRIRAAGTPVHLTLADDCPEHGDVVFRVVQEALTNVVRHARDAAATVEVVRDADVLRVVVRDDGPPASAGRERGYGLIGLSERVAAVGGVLTAGPGPGGTGFVVEALLPVGGDGDAHRAAEVGPRGGGAS